MNKYTKEPEEVIVFTYFDLMVKREMETLTRYGIQWSIDFDGFFIIKSDDTEPHRMTNSEVLVVRPSQWTVSSENFSNIPISENPASFEFMSDMTWDMICLKARWISKDSQVERIAERVFNQLWKEKSLTSAE